MFIVHLDGFGVAITLDKIEYSSISIQGQKSQILAVWNQGSYKDAKSSRTVAVEVL